MAMLSAVLFVMVCPDGSRGTIEAQTEKLKFLYDKMMEEFLNNGFDLAAIQAVRYFQYLPNYVVKLLPLPLSLSCSSKY